MTRRCGLLATAGAAGNLARGLVEGNVKVENIVDASIVNEVAKEMGPYKGVRA